MTNKDFYAYCRDQRKVEPDAHKKAVLADIYGFLRECGVSKQGVRDYINHAIFKLEHGHWAGGQPRIDAWRWLQNIFDGTITTTTTQPAQTLFL